MFAQKVAKVAGGPSRVEKAKIAVLQFCLSPPKVTPRHGAVNMARLITVSRFLLAL